MEILVAVLRGAEIPASQGTVVTLESKPIAAIVKADVEAVRAWRRREQAAANPHARPEGRRLRDQSRVVAPPAHFLLGHR
jgi:hypothetical protein